MRIIDTAESSHIVGCMNEQPAIKDAGVGPDPRVLCATRTCLFLDVDGTLIEFASTPGEARVNSATIELLSRLQNLLDGAMALISGRQLAALDEMFFPLLLPAAGIHGFERRNVSGQVFRPSVSTDRLDQTRQRLQPALRRYKGLLLEDKGYALALHYRNAPEDADVAVETMSGAAAELGPEYEIVAGAAVVEVKPSRQNKGTAIDAFMKEAPFAGRMPVFLGDDITDYAGFAAVRSHGGFDISVSRRVTARWYLEGPAATHAWLTRLERCLKGGDKT
jgi:trehalose 6-phosphate phosphatase